MVAVLLTLAVVFFPSLREWNPCLGDRVSALNTHVMSKKENFIQIVFSWNKYLMATFFFAS